MLPGAILSQVRGRTHILTLAFLAVVSWTAGAFPVSGHAAKSNLKACYKKKTGALRMISGAKRCKRGERKVSWGRKGPRGSRGLQGPAGAAGAVGAPGAAGGVGQSGGGVPGPMGPT